MTLEELFRQTVQRLQTHAVRFAVAGGVATSIYRKEKRTTEDVDFLLLASADTEKLAERILEETDLKVHLIRKADLDGGPMFAIKRHNTTVLIVAGRKEDDKTHPGLDFLLPGFPWFEEALRRSEGYRVDFGFGAIPCMTVEDVILAKFHSLDRNSKRFKDLDDLQSIFEAQQNLDLAYLASQMRKLKIVVPSQIKESVPPVLRTVSKKIRSQLRRDLAR